MARKVRLGVLVPSSNTALEPLTCSIISSIPSQSLDISISVHFSRFRVTTISLSQGANVQFNLDSILPAVRLLADAKVDVIGWSGTAAGWLGFETDERLCSAIEAEVGIRATTSTLALNKVLHILNVKEMGLVTPYLEAMNDAIRTNYAQVGVNIDKSRECHLGLTDNHSIGEIDESTLDRMVESVAQGDVDVVSTFCTNLHAAHRVDDWEIRHGVIVLDTVSTVVWDMLRMANIPPKVVKGWGRLFAC